MAVWIAAVAVIVMAGLVAAGWRWWLRRRTAYLHEVRDNVLALQRLLESAGPGQVVSQHVLQGDDPARGRQLDDLGQRVHDPRLRSLCRQIERRLRLLSGVAPHGTLPAGTGNERLVEIRRQVVDGTKAVMESIDAAIERMNELERPVIGERAGRSARRRRQAPRRRRPDR